MTSERELEALALHALEDAYKHVGHKAPFPLIDCAKLIARRLQPARVPEGWKLGRLPNGHIKLTKDGVGDYAKIEVHGRHMLHGFFCDLLSATPASEAVKDVTDDPHEFGAGIKPNPKAAYWEQRARFWRDHALSLGYVPGDSRDDRPAPPPAEPDASTAFEGWSAAVNAASELETNAPDERYQVRANTVRRWIEKRKPEAGQREGVEDQLSRELAQDNGSDYTQYEQGRIAEKRRCIDLLRAERLASAQQAGNRPATGTVADYPDEDLLRRAVCNLAPRARRQPAWARIGDVFALGSTYSKQLCRRFGIDPDTGKTTQRTGSRGEGE